MARGIPIELSTRRFSKKGDAISFFKDMLNRYVPGQRVSDEDSLDLHALLKLHTDYIAKNGCGISYFQVMTADFDTQCFCLVRNDGTAIDFSYHHCITPKKR